MFSNKFALLSDSDSEEETIQNGWDMIIDNSHEECIKSDDEGETTPYNLFDKGPLGKTINGSTLTIDRNNKKHRFTLRITQKVEFPPPPKTQYNNWISDSEDSDSEDSDSEGSIPPLIDEPICKFKFGSHPSGYNNDFPPSSEQDEFNELYNSF